MSIRTLWQVKAVRVSRQGDFPTLDVREVRGTEMPEAPGYYSLDTPDPEAVEVGRLDVDLFATEREALVRAKALCIFTYEHLNARLAASPDLTGR